MRPTRLSAVLSLLACSVGCDVGEASRANGRKLELTRLTPLNFEGLDCDYSESDCGVAANRPITVRFNRWLLPSTATRQSIRIGVEGSNSSLFTEPRYEVLARTVTYHSSGLIPGVVYELDLMDANTPPYGWGFAAYDTTALDRANLPSAVVFRTKSAEAKYTAVSEVQTLCRDVLRAFAVSGCTLSNCHKSYDNLPAAAGLHLDSKLGLESMIGRIAHATDRAEQSGLATNLPKRFGLNMPVVLPSQPATSFLLYRMLLGEEAYRDKSGAYAVLPPSRDELLYAASWFGTIGPMPPEAIGFPKGISPVDQVRIVESWIRDGAETEFCDP